MANVGNIAVQLSLDAALFTSGLDKSTQQGKAFASNITKAFSGIGAGIAGLEGITGGASSLYQSFKSGLDEIVDTGREAKTLGLSLDALGGINLLLGKDAEAAGHAFQHFSAHLSEAAASGGEALKPFGQLGIDIKQLEGLSFDKTLGKVIDKLNGLNANAKNDLAKELFGREGPSIIADIEAGSKGIAEAVATIKAHGGIGFNEKDFANAVGAQRSVKEMENSFNRIRLTLVSELAPVVKEVADWISDAAGNAGGGLKNAFKEAALVLVDGLSAGADSMQQMAVAAHDFVKPWLAIWPVLGPILKFAFGPSPPILLYNKLNELAGVSPKDTFAADVAKQNKSFQDHLQAARNALNGVGGKSHGDAAGAGGLFDYDKFKKFGEDAKRIIEETQSPLQKFNEKFGQLKELLTAGKLTPDQYALALAKDFSALAGKGRDAHAPGALLEGSLAAHSAEVNFQRENAGHGSIQEQMKTVLEEIREQEKAQLQEAKKLVEAVKNLTGVNPF